MHSPGSLCLYRKPLILVCRLIQPHSYNMDLAVNNKKKVSVQASVCLASLGSKIKETASLTPIFGVVIKIIGVIMKIIFDDGIIFKSLNSQLLVMGILGEEHTILIIQKSRFSTF